MRFMIMVKATAPSEAGLMAPAALLTSMTDYQAQLAKAGVLLDGSALQPKDKGWQVHYDANGLRAVIDGPLAETNEFVAGYTLIQVRSRDEALEWSRRFPASLAEGVEAEIEVRQLY